MMLMMAVLRGHQPAQAVVRVQNLCPSRRGSGRCAPRGMRGPLRSPGGRRGTQPGRPTRSWWPASTERVASAPSCCETGVAACIWRLRCPGEGRWHSHHGGWAAARRPDGAGPHERLSAWHECLMRAPGASGSGHRSNRRRRVRHRAGSGEPVRAAVMGAPRHRHRALRHCRRCRAGDGGGCTEAEPIVGRRSGWAVGAGLAALPTGAPRVSATGLPTPGLPTTAGSPTAGLPAAGLPTAAPAAVPQPTGSRSAPTLGEPR